MKRTGFSSAIESSSRSGNRISSWRLAPWIKPMQVQNSKKAKQCLVVVNSAIVYQNIAFSHSLAQRSALEKHSHDTQTALLCNFIGSQYLCTGLSRWSSHSHYFSG